jgi:hypothetical protein
MIGPITPGSFRFLMVTIISIIFLGMRYCFNFAILATMQLQRIQIPHYDRFSFISHGHNMRSHLLPYILTPIIHRSIRSTTTGYVCQGSRALLRRALPRASFITRPPISSCSQSSHDNVLVFHGLMSTQTL